MTRTPLAAALLLLAAAASAAVPQRLNYQGKLADASGNPLSGTYSFRFKLFAAETGGAALFSEDVTGGNAVSVANGIYTVQIGSYTAGGIPYGVFDGPDLYLEIDVQAGATLSSPETLAPRERLNSAAWAVHALGAERLGAGAVISTHTALGDLLIARNVLASSGMITGSYFSVGGSTLVVTGGNVGIGTTAPIQKIDINDGSIRVSAASANRALEFDAGAGNIATLIAHKQGSLMRWQYGASANSGVNDLEFWRYNDAGTFQGTVLFLQRATGNVGVGTSGPGNKLSVNGTVGWNGDLNVLSTDQGGSVELGGNNSTANPSVQKRPYIDFHGSAVATDYDGRIILQDGALNVETPGGIRLSVSTTSGNVGVGTSSPTQKVDVRGSLQAYGVSVSTDNASRHGLWLAMYGDFNHVLYNDFSNIDAEGAWDGVKWNVFNGLNVRIGAGPSRPSALFVEGPTSGNVGIGTTSPGAKLDVAGHQLFSVAGASITFNAGGPTIGIPTGNTLAFGTSGIERARIDNLGNVGIGTASPVESLHVVGSMRRNNVRQVTLSRSLNGSTAGNFVNIGTFAQTTSGVYAKLKLYGTVTNTVQMVEYEFHNTDYPTQGGWIELPLKAGMRFGGSHNFAVDVRQPLSNVPVEARIRLLQTNGAEVLPLTIEMETNASFTPDSASGAGATVVAGYLSQESFQFPVASTRWTNSTLGLFIDSSGNAGVGTTSPAARLDVSGQAGSPPRNMILRNSAAEDATTRFIDFIRSDVDSEFIVYNNGDVRADGTFSGPADYAEYFHSDDATLKPGELVCLAGEAKVKRCAGAGETLIGVVSTRPGMLGIYADDVTAAAEKSDKDPRWVKVGLMGQIPTKFSAAAGAVKAGEQLTVGPDGTAVKGGSPRTLLLIVLENAGADGHVRTLVK